jgi:chromosome segregation ATPase
VARNPNDERLDVELEWPADELSRPLTPGNVRLPDESLRARRSRALPVHVEVAAPSKTARAIDELAARVSRLTTIVNHLQTSLEERSANTARFEGETPEALDAARDLSADLGAVREELGAAREEWSRREIRYDELQNALEQLIGEIRALRKKIPVSRARRTVTIDEAQVAQIADAVAAAARQSQTGTQTRRRRTS